MTGRQDEAYLLGLRLRGRRVVVVGGGAVAARRVPRLLAVGADVLLISPQATPTLEDLAAANRIEWRQREYQEGDCAGAWLVCACAGPASVNAQVASEAESQRVWCVRADDARESTAWTPAAGAATDVSVGVLSGDPRRSAAIRDAITKGIAAGTIAARHYRQRAAGVALVGGGPGDPGLITVRGRQLLAEADVVITDRLAPRELLAELPPDVHPFFVATQAHPEFLSRPTRPHPLFSGLIAAAIARSRSAEATAAATVAAAKAVASA